jgi:hypothetical protein
MRNIAGVVTSTMTNSVSRSNGFTKSFRATAIDESNASWTGVVNL